MDLEQFDHPGTLQCARYVAMKLVQAVTSNNKRLQAVTCAWLCSRMPELRLIKVEDRGTEIDLELITE